MAKINKVAHVVLNVRDVQASAKWYADTLGMELMAYNEERQMAFLSFGAQHHDLALFKARGDTGPDSVGLDHVALQVDGGVEELRAMYGRLLEHGVQVGGVMDHGITNSVYFTDPDGNGLEIFCEMMEPEEARKFLGETRGIARPLTLEPAAKE